LAQAGADVALADIQAEPVERIGAEIAGQSGRRTLGAAADVTSKESVERLVERVVETLGKVDILVNAAGVTRRAPAEEFPEDEWDRILAVNLKGTFLPCQAVGKHLISRGAPGSIVNLASVAGLAGLPESIAYCASKGGVVQVTRTLGVEWARYNIRVNALAPSWFDTQMGQSVNAIDRVYAPGVRRPTAEWLHQHTLARVPLGRMGKPEELVGAVVYLASDASAMVTGHILAIDGGFGAE
jgi:NAD(P)-dependent dehydrogenase (short-subunit alcohol dehydrogenase family)